MSRVSCHLPTPWRTFRAQRRLNIDEYAFLGKSFSHFRLFPIKSTENNSTCCKCLSSAYRRCLFFGPERTRVSRTKNSRFSFSRKIGNIEFFLILGGQSPLEPPSTPTADNLKTYLNLTTICSYVLYAQRLQRAVRITLRVRPCHR